MKKKLDLNIPHSPFRASDISNSRHATSTQKKTGHVQNPCLLQRVDEITTLGQKRGLENDSDICSTDLVLGNYNFPLDSLSKSDASGICQSSGGGGLSNLVKPIWEMKVGDDTQTLQINDNSKLCHSPGNNSRKFCNSLALYSKDDMDKSCSYERDHPSHERFPPICFGWTTESPKGTTHFGISELSFGHSPNNFLSLSTHGHEKENGQVCKKNKIHEVPDSQDHVQCGFLHYEPPEFKVLQVSTKIEGKVSGFCSTPPSQILKSYQVDSSPESILRNSAKSYTKTPSIIRKRAYQSYRDETRSGNASTPGVLFSSTSQSKDSSIPNSSSVEQTFASKDSRYEESSIGRTLERRLDYAFDREWKPRISAISSSTGLISAENVMKTIS